MRTETATNQDGCVDNANSPLFSSIGLTGAVKDELPVGFWPQGLLL